MSASEVNGVLAHVGVSILMKMVLCLRFRNRRIIAPILAGCNECQSFNKANYLGNEDIVNVDSVARPSWNVSSR